MSVVSVVFIVFFLIEPRLSRQGGINRFPCQACV